MQFRFKISSSSASAFSFFSKKVKFSNMQTIYSKVIFKGHQGEIFCLQRCHQSHPGLPYIFFQIPVTHLLRHLRLSARSRKYAQFSTLFLVSILSARQICTHSFHPSTGRAHRINSAFYIFSYQAPSSLPSADDEPLPVMILHDPTMHCKATRISMPIE